MERIICLHYIFSIIFSSSDSFVWIFFMERIIKMAGKMESFLHVVIEGFCCLCGCIHESRQKPEKEEHENKVHKKSKNRD